MISLEEYTILAKEQFGHSYTFWTMALMIFSPVSNSSHHPLEEKFINFLLISFLVNQANFLIGYEVITMIIVLKKPLGTDSNQENWMLVLKVNSDMYKYPSKPT